MLYVSGDIHRSKMLIHEKQVFLELISSGVTRAELGDSLPSDNFGLIDLQQNRVDVKLNGRRPPKAIAVSLRAEDWRRA